MRDSDERARYAEGMAELSVLMEALCERLAAQPAPPRIAALATELQAALEAEIAKSTRRRD